MLDKSKWISAPSEFGTVCPMFRKTFDAKREISCAKLKITAIGCYVAHINGKRVGSFVLAPGWTAYHSRLQVQEYDVTGLLEEENTLDIEAGDGWHLGRLAWIEAKKFGKNPSVIFELEIKYKDGTASLIVSDETTKISKSPILFSSIYDGEIFDSRVEEFKWEPAKVMEYTKDTLIPQEGEEIVEVERLTPIAVTKSKTGYVLDFGQNLTGYVEFTVNAPYGHVVELYHGEILDKSGDVYIDNLRSALQRIQFIANGKKTTYKPKFTFQGFRYVRVVNWIGEPDPKDFTAIVVHSNIKRTGYFSCSNEKVNKLFENIIWGQKGNFLDVPTDCPQRDERLGWTGDAQMFIKTATYNFDVERFFIKWLSDLAVEQFEDGGVPAVIPNVLGKVSSSSSAWGDAAVICPWQIYLSYGNKEILKRQYDSMCKWIDYIKNQGDNPYIWNTGHHYGDWLGLDAPYGSYVGATDKSLIATAYFAYSTAIVIKAGKVLGYDTTEYEKLYDNVKKAFQDTFIKDGRLTSDTQTAHALVIFFDLADDLAPFGERLNTLIKENGNKLTTGFVGTPYLLHALSKTGYHETAYSLLLQEEFPSWLYSVNQGATTIWEHWDGINDEGKLWSADMNSFNHYAYGAVADWMYEVMAGIKIDESSPAFSNIIFEPITDKRIDFVSASIETKNGVVSSSWKRDGKTVTYTFNVPQGTTATIYLNGSKYTVESGEHVFTTEE
ncbi:MAG: family 78 glycoside hydrolase catalytic domain [Eubacteriales bacterium]|jgi:alpha-L-rhamnosidase|nr:family 78 glycoside hydrolase catalytic domain [Eubacteriales bacterium]